MSTGLSNHRERGRAMKYAHLYLTDGQVGPFHIRAYKNAEGPESLKSVALPDHPEAPTPVTDRKVEGPHERYGFLASFTTHAKRTGEPTPVIHLPLVPSRCLFDSPWAAIAGNQGAGYTNFTHVIAESDDDGVIQRLLGSAGSGGARPETVAMIGALVMAPLADPLVHYGWRTSGGVGHGGVDRRESTPGMWTWGQVSRWEMTNFEPRPVLAERGAE